MGLQMGAGFLSPKWAAVIMTTASFTVFTGLNHSDTKREILNSAMPALVEQDPPLMALKDVQTEADVEKAMRKLYFEYNHVLGDAKHLFIHASAQLGTPELSSEYYDLTGNDTMATISPKIGFLKDSVNQLLKLQPYSGYAQPGSPAARAQMLGQELNDLDIYAERLQGLEMLIAQQSGGYNLAPTRSF